MVEEIVTRHQHPTAVPFVRRTSSRPRTVLGVKFFTLRRQWVTEFSYFCFALGLCLRACTQWCSRRFDPTE